MEKVLNFLKDLSLNNNKEWFDAHKGEYMVVKDYITTFTQSLLNAVSTFDPEARYLTPSQCTYRIYRDTRFSADKTPYKDHIGIFINPPQGKKSYRMGYYLHLQPGACEIGAGNVCLPSKLITDIRTSIRDNIDEYLAIIRKPEFKRLFPSIGFNCVKTAPKGFSKDWEYIELVKPRDFYVSHTLKDKEVTAKNFTEKAAEIFEVTKPFCDFLNYTIDDFSE